MGIALGSNFDVQTNLPLDSRTVVTDITARDAISSLRRYEGMSVYVIATQKEYTLKGGITNSEWTEAMAQGVTVVNTATDRDAITLISRYEGMLVYVKDSKITYQMTSGALTNDGWTYYYGVTASDDVGEIITSARDLSDPHEGTLPCDGATLYDATLYTTLAAKFWNSTQSKWKFGGTGTYPTGQFRTPNLKGAFVRGADLGAGRDLDAATRTASGVNGVTGDAVGSYQDEAFKSHTHIQDAHNHTQNPHTHSMNQLADTVGTTGAIGTRVNVSFDQYTNAATATNNPTTATNQNAGGSETRPKNIAVNFFVRYKPSTRGPKGDTGNAINVVADDTARLAIPAGDRFDGYLAYVQSTKKDWQLQGGINNTDWKEIGTGGSGSGNINFVSNPDGNQGVTGWTEGSYAAAIRPSGSFTASSGAGAFAISTTSTTPLGIGTTSFLLTKTTGASRQGRAIETSFALPLSYRAKVLQLNIDYIINSGTFVAGSNTTDSSLIWYCAFSTDGGSTYSVSEPSSFNLLSNSTTISDKFSASIQTPYNATNMKLIAYVAESANSAWVVETIVSVSPSQYVFGTPIKDLAPYTASLSYAGTVATNISSQTYRWAKTGDRLSIEGAIIFNGAANANGVFRIPLPPGLIVDTSKTSGAFQKLNGTVSFFQNSGSKFYGLGLPVLDGATNGGANNYFLVNSVTYNGLGLQQWQGSTTGISNNPTGAALAAGDALEFSISDIPILGWSSSVQVSDGYDGRVVAANVSRATGTAAQSIPNNTYTGVGFDTKNFDTTNDFTLSPSSNGSYFTVKSAGYYRVSASITFTGNGTNARLLVIAKNTPSGVIEHLATSAGTAAAVTLSGTRTIYANADDKIYISAYQDSGAALNLSQLWNEASIEKLAGNPVISATETVAARYTSAAGQSIPNGGVFTILDFGTKSIDTVGAVTTGTSWKYTAQSYCLIEVSTSILFNSATWTTNDAANMRLFKNGVAYANLSRFEAQATIAQFGNLNGSTIVKLNAGDYIDVRVSSTRTGGATSLIADSLFNHISIKRVK